jgi:hypothetical protein
MQTNHSIRRYSSLLINGGDICTGPRPDTRSDAYCVDYNSPLACGTTSHLALLLIKYVLMCPNISQDAFATTLPHVLPRAVATAK